MKIEVHAARGLASIELSFTHGTYCVIVAVASPGERKMWAAVRENGDFFALEVRITGKLLNIDGYMLRGVWQALNCLFIYAAFCVIATGASPGKNINCGNLIIHDVAGLLEPTVVSNRQACSLLKNINLSRLQV